MGLDEKKNGPVFDYSTFSYKAQKADYRTRLRIQRLVQQIDEAGAALDDDDFEALLDQLDTLRDKLDHSMSKHIVSVPVDWLVATAPKSPEWEKAESLSHVRADRMDALRMAASEARSPEEVSGN